MIVSERFKSYSIFSEQEAINSLAKEIENFSDEEREAFFTCLTDSEYEREINGLELDREIVGVEQWIEDDYYMGGVGKSIWKPWKDDLVELFESDEYSSAVIVGGIGCAEICLPVMTSEGLIPIGDLSSKPHKYLSFDGSGYKYVQGTQSFPKGKGMLYRVSHDEGEFTVTGNHLVMCANHRYRKVETLSPLTPILSSSLQQTQEKNGISYVQLVKGKVLDCLGDHLKDLHCGDELLLLLSNIGLALSPLSNDFQQSSLGKKDGPLKLKLSFDQVSAYLSGHHSMQNFFRQLEHQLSDCLSHSYARISQQSYEFCRHLQQSGTEKDLDRIILKLSAFARQTFLTLPLGSDHREVLQHLSVVDHFFGSTPQRQNLSRHKALQSRSKVLIHLITLLFSSLSPQKSQKVSLVANSASRHTQLRSMLKYLVSWQGQQRRSCRQSIRSAYLKCLGLVHSPFSQTPLQTSIIRSIEKVKTDWYWDLQVPGTNNYVSGGAVHHNSGKSTFSHLATIRMLYEASCLKNPAVSYGLSPNSVIGFCNLAKSKQTARKVVFEGIVEKLAESPYFKYDFAPLKNLKEEILFPKNLSIIAGSSTDTSVIGMNIFGGIFDEGNFMREAAKKTKANMANQKIWGNQSKAGRLFEAVQRRMKSRYMTKGKLPGVLIVVSSKTTHDSFTEQLIRKAQASGSTSTFVRDRNVIDMKRDVFEDETFRVLVGSELYPSKILDKDESKDKYPGGIIIDIPVDFLDDFKENIGDALRDIAGVSTMAISQFMKEPGKIDAMDDGREHPFMCALMGDTQQWDSRLPYKIHWDQIARRLPNGDWEPKLNPHAKRHVHFDPALTGDAFGIVVGHIEGTVPVLQSGLGHGVYEHQPVFVVDFVLRIQGEPGEEVLFKAVRQLCYGFSHHGFHLAEFTMDTYQSREMVQALREQGYKAGIYSVDTGIGSMSEDGSESSKERQMEGAGEGRRKQAYRYLRQTIMDGRIKSYRYPVLFEELKRLEDGPVMIDHPENGCFVGETRIPLLDGTFPMISELTGKEVWVYSCKPDGTIVPGKARGRKTKEVTSLVDIILDSGAVARCTPEHRWMLRDGTYKEAKDLRPGIDRLMPINQQWPVNGGYERLSGRNFERVLTHHMVVKHFGDAIRKGELVHHRNGDKVDNRPENLEVICHKEHARSHTTERHRTDPEWRKRLYAGAKKFNESDDGREKHRAAMKKTNGQMDYSAIARCNENFRSDINLPRLREVLCDSNVENNANAASRFLGCGRNVIVRVLKEHGFSGWQEFSASVGNNHKVRAVIPVKLERPVAVYDLEVDEWNNFALSCGVFVHNSKDCADALAGCIWTLFRADYYVEPLSPVLGESVVMSDNVDFGMMVNENFEPRKVHGDAIEVKNPNRPLAPRDYEKRKGPKTLKPTYRKIGHDGSIEDLTMVPDEIDLDNYITRG